jgi:hypothetical protein
VWDLETGQYSQLLSGHRSPIRALQFFDYGVARYYCEQKTAYQVLVNVLSLVGCCSWWWWYAHNSVVVAMESKCGICAVALVTELWQVMPSKSHAFNSTIGVLHRVGWTVR